MGIDEKLGSMVPLDLPFVTESGDTVRLKDILKGPTILSILYYKCPNACNTLIMSIANVLRSITDKPGPAPNVITMTVDEHETSEDAMKAKTIAFETLQKPYPCGPLAFPYRERGEYKKNDRCRRVQICKKRRRIRPSALPHHPFAAGESDPLHHGHRLPPDGHHHVAYGSVAGTARPAIARVLRACFSYDPKSHRYVFNILRVSATVIFSFIGIFIVYLVISGRKRRARGQR